MFLSCPWTAKFIGWALVAYFRSSVWIVGNILFGSVKHLSFRSTDRGRVDRKGICLKTRHCVHCVKKEAFETNCNPNAQLHRLIGLDWAYLMLSTEVCEFGVLGCVWKSFLLKRALLSEYSSTHKVKPNILLSFLPSSNLNYQTFWKLTPCHLCPNATSKKRPFLTWDICVLSWVETTASVSAGRRSLWYLNVPQSRMGRFRGEVKPAWADPHSNPWSVCLLF